MSTGQQEMAEAFLAEEDGEFVEVDEDTVDWQTPRGPEELAKLMQDFQLAGIPLR